MHNRLIGFASCLIVLVLGGSAFARDTEDSPEYKAWKEWKAGATARMRTEVTEGGTKTIATTTVTLKKKAADRLVLEMAISTEVAGMKIEAPAAPMEVPARRPKVPVDPKAKETTGRETLTVNGKKLECEWMQVEKGSEVRKTWTCKDVPGGVVKETIRSEGSTTQSQVLDWKGEKE